MSKIIYEKSTNISQFLVEKHEDDLYSISNRYLEFFAGESFTKEQLEELYKKIGAELQTTREVM